GPYGHWRRAMSDAGRDEQVPENGRHHVPPGRGHEPPADQQARLPPGSRAEVRRRILLRDRGRGPRVVTHATPKRESFDPALPRWPRRLRQSVLLGRSEERRVGKEC